MKDLLSLAGFIFAVIIGTIFLNNYVIRFKAPNALNLSFWKDINLSLSSCLESRYLCIFLSVKASKWLISFAHFCRVTPKNTYRHLLYLQFKIEFVALSEVQIAGEGFHTLPFVLSFKLAFGSRLYHMFIVGVDAHIDPFFRAIRESPLQQSI